ncbi:MAG: LysR family transcriptional regulator [Eggerthellaceae bacterium]|jgi:LysR family transcriptional activator of glutamate synthase operon
MNEQQMRYFLDVAETQHITQSAQRLHIAQPALSRTIRHLEQELGCTLLAHEGRNVRLTEAGRRTRDRFAAAVAQLDALRDDLAALSADRAHLVRVDVRAASYLTVEAISSWMAAHPESTIRLVQAGETASPVDVVVHCPLPDAAPLAGRESRSFRERILVALPESADVPQGPVGFPALEHAGFVALSGSRGFRQVCDRLCARSGFTPRIALESDNPAVVRKAIALGLGVGFWPEWSWGSVEGDGVGLREVDAPRFERTISVVRKTEQGAAFFAFLCSFFERCARTARR